MSSILKNLQCRTSWLLFFGVFSFYGLFINVADQRAFNLQQMGVDALVEHGSYELGQSSHPLFRPGGDTFQFEGKVFSNKQPGLSALGALVYWPLRAVGISYDDHYDLASALITWIVSAGFAAIGVVFFYRIVHDVWGFTRKSSVICALLYACGTTVLPYSGLLYHDTVAGALLVIAFFYLERTRLLPSTDGKVGAAAAAGVLLGGAICVSLLPLVLVPLLLGYGCVWCRRQSLVALLAGFAVGLVPLLAYNWLSFGSPFLMGYIALGDSQISPDVSVAHMAYQLSQYLLWGKVAILKYSPVVALGLLALPLLSKRVRPAAVIISVLTGSHLIYIATMPTLGVCQFPPRFLLPLMPFAVLPMAGLLERESVRSRVAGLAVLLVTALLSVSFNLLGALHGVMNCDIYRWLPARMFAENASLLQADFPLWQPAAVLLALTLLAARSREFDS